MLTKHTRNLKQLALFVLIIIMLSPSVVLAAEPQHDAPYFNRSNPTPMGYYTPALLTESNGAANDYTSGTTGILNGLSPADIEELLNEQASLWRQDPNVQASIRFYDLINSSYPYSSLP